MCDRHFAKGDHFNFTILLFRKWIKKSCVLCRNFISIYKINRTLHGRLGIQISSSPAESISHSFASLTRRERYFQHSRIKFVSPRGQVISSIYSLLLFFNLVMLNKMKFSLRTLRYYSSGKRAFTPFSNFYNLLPVQ